MNQTFAVYLSVFAATFLGVEIFRRWSYRRNLLDVPNERSSHSVPTPRGGGVVIFVCSMTAFLFYGFQRQDIPWAFLVGALLVAAISLADDVHPVSPFIRIFFHAAAAALTVWAYGGFKLVLVPFGGVAALGGWGDLIAFLWIVWLINAYNFMDGIDGIAAAQSITAGTGWYLTGCVLGIPEISFTGGVLCFTAFGFLILNWHPAKIFMGDVGSAFFGYCFAVIPLLAHQKGLDAPREAFLPWIALLLVWFFVFDSVLTFCRRLLRGAKVWLPHREHLYQKMVISGLSHAAVTGVYAGLSAGIAAALLISLKYLLNSETVVFGTTLLATLTLLVIRKLSGGKRSVQTG